MGCLSPFKNDTLRFASLAASKKRSRKNPVFRQRFGRGGSQKVVTEKGSFLATAMILISAGSAKAIEGDLVGGLILILLGLLILYTREALKLNRWETKTYWRGKRAR